MTTVYTSKIDRWILVVVIVALLVLLVSIVTLLSQHVGPFELGVVAFNLIVAGFMGWTFLGTRYIVSDHAIDVRSGPFRWTIALADIREIAPSRNPLSSPALSLDRLAIRRVGGGLDVLVSPADKRAFLDDIAGRSPAHRVEGDRLVRADPRA